jgi:hypothetical protein
MNLRPIRHLREINQTLTELHDAEQVAAEAARFELARSATRFSQRTQEVVDGTMSLSAVLMRAGQVDEANRLLAEIQNDVQSEKAVLLETVHEVKAQGAVRRRRMTRLKLARMLATAMLGGSLFVFSAVGVAVAGFLSDDDRRAEASETTRHNSRGEAGQSARDSRHVIRRIKVSGMNLKVVLTPGELREYKSLLASDSHPDDIDDFIMGLLPTELVDKIAAAMETGEEAAETLTRLVTSASAKASKQQEAAAEDPGTDETEADETGDQESPEPPAEEPAPKPSNQQGSGGGKEERGEEPENGETKDPDDGPLSDLPL